jgi:hypothetical protein
MNRGLRATLLSGSDVSARNESSCNYRSSDLLYQESCISYGHIGVTSINKFNVQMALALPFESGLGSDSPQRHHEKSKSGGDHRAPCH